MAEAEKNKIMDNLDTDDWTADKNDWKQYAQQQGQEIDEPVSGEGFERALKFIFGVILFVLTFPFSLLVFLFG